MHIEIILTKLSSYDAQQKKYNEFMKKIAMNIGKYKENKNIDEENKKNDYSKGSEVRSSDKTDY
ncbi:hypothetical protein GCM10020331_029080 [Ectobacillus funiculus]